LPREVSRRALAPGRATLKICELCSSRRSTMRWKAIAPRLPGKVASAAGAAPATTAAAATAMSAAKAWTAIGDHALHLSPPRMGAQRRLRCPAPDQWHRYGHH
jgi:hypothetical protein